jgi:WD40 repeat protein
VNAICITPDGKKIISESWNITIKIWDIENGEELKTLNGHQSYVNLVHITPDGKKIISGSHDKTIKI